MKSIKNRNIITPKKFSLTEFEPYKKLGLSPIVARFLDIRGIDYKNSLDFLIPTLKSLLPNPNHLKDMEAMVARLIKAIENKEKVCIWGDYDVDGACSTALIVRALRFYGLDPDFYIPDRIEEGYGPNSEGFQKLFDDSVDLVIVVDAGTLAFGPISHANSIGLDVVVIDHHLAHNELPNALIVNPNRLDQESSIKNCCAAGVCFLVLVALNSALKEKGPVFDLMGVLDIVALATVADVMSLQGLNRAYVKQGIKITPTNPGLRALVEVSGIKGAIKSYHYGFALGPRINAGGRIGDAKLGAKLLTEDDPAICESIAKKLSSLNIERQNMEKAIIEEVNELLDPNDSVIFLNGDFHEGVIGIIASRMKEKHDKPSFIFTKTPDGFFKGSGRSLTGFDLGEVVFKALERNLLIKGGGHQMAAGVSVTPENLEKFKDLFREEFEKTEVFKEGINQRIDLLCPLRLASFDIIDDLEQFEPFGQGNPKPVLLFPNCVIKSATLMGNFEHLKLNVESEGKSLNVLGFSMGGSKLSDTLLNSIGKTIDIIGSLESNTFKDQTSLQIRIQDAVIKS